MQCIHENYFALYFTLNGVTVQLNWNKGTGTTIVLVYYATGKQSLEQVTQLPLPQGKGISLTRNRMNSTLQ